jgi:hypothetical protein
MRPNRSDVSFDEAAEAHHFIRDRNNIGKVALTQYGLDQGPCRHRLTKR